VAEGATTASVSFSNVSGGAGGYTYSYDFNNSGTFQVSNSTSASATIPESYVNDGPATLTVHGRVTDSAGNFADYTTSITVTNVPPTPSIGLPSSAVAGSAATFTASASDPSTADTNAGFSYSWDFGDGTAAVAGASASHTYAAPGTYTVTLTATDKDGGQGTSTASLTVSAAGQGATATFVRLDTTTQGSWMGAYGHDGYNVIDGAVSYPSYAQVTPSGQTNHVWKANTRNVRALQVPGGGRVAATWYSTTSYTVDVNLTDGQTHGLALYLLDWDRGGLSERIDVKDALSGATLGSWTVSSFANGEYLVLNVSGHVTVQLTRLAGADCDLSGLFFDPQWGGPGSPLSATFAGPASAAEGASTASVAFSSVTGGTGGYTYSYDFNNDGTFEVSGSASASVTVPEAYLDDGPSTRVVHGRVTDSAGASKDYTASIAVTNVAPTPSIGLPSSAVAGSAATFTASATDPSTADKNAGFTYSWDFGDGTAAVAGASPSHSYAAAGTYTVTLTATDKDGGKGTTTASLTVNSAATSGLVAAYGFNEGTGTTAADLSFNGNTGTLSNATWTTAGKYGDALSFNGSNAYVGLGNGSSLQM
jgi:PKD repeat protein